jgi:hypothetical protein
MSSATHAEPASHSTAEIIALRLVIIGVAAACVVEFWYANSHTDEYRLQSPLFTPRLWNLYLTYKLASVVALIGMWNWHKWGLVLLTALGVLSLFTEFYSAESYSAVFLLNALRIPLMLAAIWFLAQRVWSRFT